MSSYLLVFFNDATHSLFMATSSDGYTFTAVNDGKPIILGDTIAEQRGIRDPHIMRGPDGKFYLAMTDLHIFAQRDGLRDTEWERPGEEYGWGNNRGLVLMKSDDLINWTRSNVRIDKLFPKKFGNIGCAWAPETVYDPKAGKKMIYFTMRIGNGRTDMYYAYTDDEFTTLVSEPKKLFTYPDKKIQVLDADITQMPDGRWCMAYVAQENPGGIKVALSDKINSGWKYRADQVDGENVACEAPNVWKRYGEDKWVLMYDIFGINPHNFGFSETTDFKTFTDIGRFNEGVMKATNFKSPKHGAVISITPSEQKRLEEHWRKPESNVSKSANPILPGFHADPEILYAEKTGNYYIYSTTDGVPGWGGHYFSVFSSPDLETWTDEGVMLDVKTDQVKWADGNAWAPCIIERKYGPDDYKYYFYYSANVPETGRKAIGVAVSDSPTGPFKDFGEPIVVDSPTGWGQQIDVDVFKDPVSGKYYLYWGNGYMAGAELNDDMTSIDKSTIKVMTPEGGSLETYAYREAPYVFYRNGVYYFMWSVDDTGSPNYHVAYGTSDSPLGDIKVATPCNVLVGNSARSIYGTAHNSVLNIPGTDEWYIVYHRINPEFIDGEKGPGFHREVCIDRMYFNADGSIKKVIASADADGLYRFKSNGNPIIKHYFTADPAARVEGDTLWLYAGHDFAGDQNNYKMKDWLVFSTTDMHNWTEYPVALDITDFTWAKSGDAYAGHVVERNGKYYWYISTNWTGIGVAVSDRPEGPFKDALGRPLLTNEDCFASTHSWACIDPAVFIDDDGQAWIFWGNRECYYAKLKDNMVEIAGEIKRIEFEGLDYTEAPWVHKKDGKYYLSYASGFPEVTAYAVADNIEGPYEYKGILNEIAGNSNTNHQAIVEFDGEWYFIYHTGALQNGGGSYSRSICVDKLHHNPDGTIKRVVMTTEGI